MPPVCVEEEKQKGRMKRRKEIIRRIDPAEPIEERAQPTGRVRSRKSEA